MASQGASVLVQSRSKYSLTLPTRFSPCSSPSNLKLSSPLAGGILWMKGMKIETSASCLSGHFRSAADRTATQNGIFPEDFSRHTCPEEGSQPRCSVSSALRSHVVHTSASRVCGCGVHVDEVNAHPTRGICERRWGGWIHVASYVRKKRRWWLSARSEKDRGVAWGRKRRGWKWEIWGLPGVGVPSFRVRCRLWLRPLPGASGSPTTFLRLDCISLEYNRHDSCKVVNLSIR